MKPIIFNTDMVKAILDGRKTQTRRLAKFPEGMTGRLPEHPENQTEPLLFYPCGIKYCPYKVGDILYVRETWNQCYDGSFVYKADSKPNSGWRPSIHMPREAARLFLRVADVKVERLQEITEEDATKEGFESSLDPYTPAIWKFIDVWDGIYLYRRQGWTENPWVFVIELEVCEKPEVTCDR